MFPHFFVITSGSSGGGGSGGGSDDGSNQLCRAILGFHNLLNQSSIFLTSEDPSYPFSLAYDFKTNTEYSPLIESGSVQIDFLQAEPSTISYFGLFCKNAMDCNLSFQYEVKPFGASSYTIVGSRSVFKNAAPQMLSFDPINSSEQRLTISFDSKCFIASINTGEAVVFGRTVSAGYQPARNASLDEVSNFTTDGNNFVQGRRLMNGFQEKAPINYQSYDFIDTWWRGFMNHVLDSKPVFFMANNQKPANCVYGLQNPQTLTKPNYKNKRHTDIEFEINGWA